MVPVNTDERELFRRCAAEESRRSAGKNNEPAAPGTGHLDRRRSVTLVKLEAERHGWLHRIAEAGCCRGNFTAASQSSRTAWPIQRVLVRARLFERSC
ncbi:hypothetical protein MRX96_022424 [Rhipicephalus microplus]